MSHHTPKKTVEALTIFSKDCKLDFYDSSYKNDLLDSLEFEIEEDSFLKVFIPNSKNWDENAEEYNEYILTRDGEDVMMDSKIEKVIEYINKNYEQTYGAVCRNGKDIDKCKCC